MIKYAREILSMELLEEALPLFVNHFKEISAFQDIPLEPDYDQYLLLEQLGHLRFFSARDYESKNILGYAVLFVRNNLHYKSSKQAVQDIIFIDRGRRGFGRDFIEWCDEQLKAEGVQVVYHHVKKAHDWSKVLDEQGYKCIETVHGKRLD